MFEMKPLPYAIDALEPFMPQTTMEFHYGKHYKTYVDNLNKLIKGTEFESMSLVEIIQKTYGIPSFRGFLTMPDRCLITSSFGIPCRLWAGVNPKANCRI